MCNGSRCFKDYWGIIGIFQAPRRQRVIQIWTAQRSDNGRRSEGPLKKTNRERFNKMSTMMLTNRCRMSRGLSIKDRVEVLIS